MSNIDRPISQYIANMYPCYCSTCYSSNKFKDRAKLTQIFKNNSFRRTPD